jgi:predicted dehydrogenase
MRKIKLGIIGCGNMGSQHYSNVLNGKCPEICVTAIADINPDRLAWAKDTCEKYQAQKDGIPSLHLFSDATELIKSGEIDAVIISVPHYEHSKYAIEALKNGVHVMCEKPAGVYTLQVKEMIAEADKHPELKFGMMFNQRTNCLYRKMKEILDSGELGELHRSIWTITKWYRPQAYYDSGDWRATWAGEGGGVLLNQCPHNLDLWQWLCGMPVKVYAKMKFGKYHNIEVEDDVVACVEYENGAMGTFITSTADSPGTNRLEIVCDGGSLICENNQLIMSKLGVLESVFTKENTSPYASPTCQTFVVETDGLNEQHSGVLNAFAEAILRDEPLIADGREGIKSLTLSNAMHLSAWLEKEIELPFDEHLFKELLEERAKNSHKKENVKYVFSEFDKNHGNLRFT